MIIHILAYPLSDLLLENKAVCLILVGIVQWPSERYIQKVFHLQKD